MCGLLVIMQTVVKEDKWINHLKKYWFVKSHLPLQYCNFYISHLYYFSNCFKSQFPIQGGAKNEVFCCQREFGTTLLQNWERFGDTVEFLPSALEGSLAETHSGSTVTANIASFQTENRN